MTVDTDAESEPAADEGPDEPMRETVDTRHSSPRETSTVDDAGPNDESRNLDIFTLLGIMWRRWFVVVPVLLATAAVGFFLLAQPEVRYTADGTVLLMVNSQTEQGSQTSETISTSLASALMATALNRPAIESELRAVGLTSNFEAMVDPESTVVTLVVNGTDPADVLESAMMLVDLAPSALDRSVGSALASSVRLAVLAEPVEDDVVLMESGFSIEVPLAVLSTDAVSNPFPPGSSTMVTITELSRRMEIAQAVLGEVPSATYGVGGSTRSAAPIMTITVEAATAAEVPLVYNTVFEQLSGVLAKIQSDAGVPTAEQTVLTPLVPPAGVFQTSSSIVRPAAALAVLGIAAACGAAILTDLIIRRRRQRS
jgi:hypothetical protein